MLNEIKEKLESFNLPVYYGLVSPTVKDLDAWDYFVFRRLNDIKNGSSSCDESDYFEIAIIQENYIPEGYVDKVKAKIKEIEGIRISRNNQTYDYILKPNTDIICEVFIFDIVKAKKRVDD